MGTPASRSIARWVSPRPPSTARIWIAVSHRRSRRLTPRGYLVTAGPRHRAERAGPGGRGEHPAVDHQEQAAHAPHVGDRAVAGQGGVAGPVARGAGGDHAPNSGVMV